MCARSTHSCCIVCLVAPPCHGNVNRKKISWVTWTALPEHHLSIRISDRFFLLHFFCFPPTGNISLSRKGHLVDLFPVACVKWHGGPFIIIFFLILLLLPGLSALNQTDRSWRWISQFIRAKTRTGVTIKRQLYSHTEKKVGEDQIFCLFSSPFWTPKDTDNGSIIYAFRYCYLFPWMWCAARHPFFQPGTEWISRMETGEKPVHERERKRSITLISSSFALCPFYIYLKRGKHTHTIFIRAIHLLLSPAAAICNWLHTHCARTGGQSDCVGMFICIYKKTPCPQV